MLSDSLRVVNPLGLHARATAALVRLTSSYSSKIVLYRRDRQVAANAKSILSVLALAAGAGTELEVTVEGADEVDALQAMRDIFRSGFGELK
jgi:phosphocarrier protein